ncbi:MAG: hypothetical protein ACK4GR_04965, partial [bacterium]
LKSSKTIAAIGKNYLKNGDVFNFASEIFNKEEIEIFKAQENIEKIKNIEQNKYYVTFKKIYDEYNLTIKRIPYVSEDISTLSVINPNILISKLKNLVLFLGINNLKSKALATLINYINQKNIKRIAIIEEKLSFLYKEQQSIIDIFEFEGNLEKLQNLIRRLNNEEYDILVISTPELDLKTLKLISNYSLYRTVILNTEHKDIISFYRDYKELGDEFLKPLNIYIVHRVLKGNLHLPEIVFADNKIKELIKSENEKALKEYIVSLEETDTQTLSESIGYLAKTGKITIEEAKKYIANPEALEETEKNELEIQL